jgi:hypothetical protein
VNLVDDRPDLVSALDIRAYMISCGARTAVRAETLARLRSTDWRGEVSVVVDGSTAQRPQERQEHTALRLLKRAASDGPGFVLFLEDDLDFNRHLLHNLAGWRPLRKADPDRFLLASLYNPGIAASTEDEEGTYAVADPERVYGSQAFVLSRAILAHVIEGWHTIPGMQDIKISRLAALVTPIYYHRPSLVQHVGASSTWGGCSHSAVDFSSTWRVATASSERT